MAEAKQKNEKEQKGPSLLEWIAAALGALLVAGMFTFIAIEAIATKDSGPPMLDVTPVAIVSDGQSHVVEVKVTNRSGRTAAAVEIQGDLRRGAQLVETSHATLSYVPGQAERRAGLIFTRNPRHYSLQVRPGGYEVP